MAHRSATASSQSPCRAAAVPPCPRRSRADGRRSPAQRRRRSRSRAPPVVIPERRERPGGGQRLELGRVGCSDGPGPRHPRTAGPRRSASPGPHRPCAPRRSPAAPQVRPAPTSTGPAAPVSPERERQGLERGAPVRQVHVRGAHLHTVSSGVLGERLR